LRDQIYVGDFAGAAITTIDGATNTTTNVPTGNVIVNGVVVNPFTNKIYAIGLIENDVTVLNGVDAPLSRKVLPLIEGSLAEGDND
jgi:DNA-binding beta-propeller fold protein YncE